MPSPCHKGSNKIMNGLLRPYMPKGRGAYPGSQRTFPWTFWLTSSGWTKVHSRNMPAGTACLADTLGSVGTKSRATNVYAKGQSLLS